MTKRRICVLVTARPSYSRIRSALSAIQEHPDLELQLVVGASALLERYGSAIQAIEHDGFSPAARVYMVLEGENLVTSAKSTGLGLVELATVFDNLPPEHTRRLMGAIVAGVVLGTLAMKTRSIWSGFLIHVSVAISMDVAALMQTEGMPTVWYPG